MLVGAKRMDTKQDVEKQGKSEQKRRKPGSKEYIAIILNSCRDNIVLYSMQSWPKQILFVSYFRNYLPVTFLVVSSLLII